MPLSAYLGFYAAYLHNFSMLCTIQYNCHCAVTFASLSKLGYPGLCCCKYFQKRVQLSTSQIQAATARSNSEQANSKGHPLFFISPIYNKKQAIGNRQPRFVYRRRVSNNRQLSRGEAPTSLYYLHWLQRIKNLT
jgi:hypothetical protein